MTDTPRADRLGGPIIALSQYLDAMYQSACEVMLKALSQEHKHIMAEDGTMVLANQDQLNYALGIIDRYLRQQEADRQYALKREKADMGSELGTKIGELIVAIVNGDDPEPQHDHVWEPRADGNYKCVVCNVGRSFK